MQPSDKAPRVNAEQRIRISPDQVLEQALRYIEADGSVRLVGDDEESWQRWGPHEVVNIVDLPPDVFANKLLEVARIICGTVSNIHLNPASQEKELRLLALYLTRYRNLSNFLSHAASLTQVTMDGEILHPHLPNGSPWRRTDEFGHLRF